MILQLRSEAVCESASSIFKTNIHNNRSLQHSSLDEEVTVHWNAPPLHTADSFITNSLDCYFSTMKDKNWLFYKKSEHYQIWKLVASGSISLNRLRKAQVTRFPEPDPIE
ncbi:unnamed protein product [Rotaria sp. Silwood1]|nr:unnamed protein product [Rotaria sp. Silwood1]CAF1329848.1 unnamed protein product [Rotaria sp. Silwood1]CAF3534496.1 unnamed protein product [Rotaria sp. Silwood1]CAF3580004.1 unnamed protein product [Rotaria sp. Silwood1]CAF4937015.1 unnamed protein product [Rotaria sp. Silwood1]